MSRIRVCDDRDRAAHMVADSIETSLRAALSSGPERASLLVSGGTTPAPAYRYLSHADLEWSRVDLGLVDDRWVAEDHDASNARLVRDSLLQGPASAAKLTSMKTEHAKAEDAVDTVDRWYQPFVSPDCVVLGMGPDGHTASWFPGSDGLDVAMSADTARIVTGINAEGAPVAGTLTDRMTVTLPVLVRARQAILFITGEEKRRVLEHESAGLPIHQLLRARHHNLEVIWAP